MGTGAKIGADPFLFTESSWNYYQDGLSAKNIELIAINENLVDLVWNEMDRPENSKEEIFVHDVKYAGQGSADIGPSDEIIRTGLGQKSVELW